MCGRVFSPSSLLMSVETWAWFPSGSWCCSFPGRLCRQRPVSLWLTSCLPTEGLGGGGGQGVLFCIPVAFFPCQYPTTWEYLTGRILEKLLKTGCSALDSKLLSTQRVRSLHCSDEDSPRPGCLLRASPGLLPVPSFQCSHEPGRATPRVLLTVGRRRPERLSPCLCCPRRLPHSPHHVPTLLSLIRWEEQMGVQFPTMR